MIVVLMLGILLAGGFAYFSQDALLAIVYFIVGGHIPLTNITLSPMAMLALWTLIIPALYFFRRSISAAFWQLIQVVGDVHQRSLNRRFRMPRPRYNLTELIVIAMIHIAQELPEDMLEQPEVSLRRRFLALQS